MPASGRGAAWSVYWSNPRGRRRLPGALDV